MLASAYLSLSFSIGHLSAPVRTALLAALYQAILRDRAEHGPDARLATLGTAIGYCQSLLEDADGAELSDLTQAQLGDELRLLYATLHAARHRPGPHRQAAAVLMLTLFPDSDLPTSLAAVQGLLTLADAPELRVLCDQVGCAASLRHVAAAADRLEHSLQERTADERRWRARQALRGADGMLRRLLGYIVSITDPADEAQRERARALLTPLEEALLAQPAGDSPAAVYSAPAEGAAPAGAADTSTFRIERTFGWPGS